jgi:hypothetical protein
MLSLDVDIAEDRVNYWWMFSGDQITFSWNELLAVLHRLGSILALRK